MSMSLGRATKGACNHSAARNHIIVRPGADLETAADAADLAAATASFDSDLFP